MERKRQSRTTVQPPTNYSYWKRQVPDLFHASDREQYEYFEGNTLPDTDILQHLLNRPIIAKAIDSGALKIVNIDDLPLADDEADEEL